MNVTVTREEVVRQGRFELPSHGNRPWALPLDDRRSVGVQHEEKEDDDDEGEHRAELLIPIGGSLGLVQLVLSVTQTGSTYRDRIRPMFATLAHHRCL